MNEFTYEDGALEGHVSYGTTASSDNAQNKVSSVEELSRDISLSARQQCSAPTDDLLELRDNVQHGSQVYRDFASAEDDRSFHTSSDDIRLQKLPTKLCAMLSDPKINHIISWMPHGRAWKVWKKKEFIDSVLPQYFEYCNYNSFVRLVNAWGFRRITSGLDANSYYHELFLRGMPHLHNKMHRLKKNQKKASAPLQNDPDFYAMEKVSPLPPDNNVEGDQSTLRSIPGPVSSINSSIISLPDTHKLTLPNQPTQISPLIAAARVRQLGNAQMANYLASTQQRMALPLHHSLNTSSLIANQIFPQQQEQISQSLPTYLLGNIHANSNATAANASVGIAHSPVMNMNMNENALLNARNANAALNILNSLQQQQQQQRLLGDTSSDANIFLPGFQR